jgi:hypothetical protein
MRSMLVVLLAVAAIAVMAAPTGSAAPASGAVIAEQAGATVTPARYVRRNGMVCYRKCYREFFFGRRVCRTFC